MKTNPSGVVYLVGAGPGHPGLITRLGYDLLQQCDAVAYDALVPMELISGLSEKVEKYYVGKRAGKHSLPQSKINELLLCLAQRGLRVVRLKGGDPFIFGRSGEEAGHLAAAGVRVVMVPGVTAASAAAATAGFSLTSREAASWILLGTGHGAESAAIPVPWERIAGLAGGTFVIYMGLAKLESLIERMLASGLAPQTPAMAVQAASTGIQKSVEAPLDELSRECTRRGLKPPALILIGKAVRCRTAGGEEGKELAGRRILTTCPSRAAGALCSLLREKGGEPIPCPTVVRKPGFDPESWKRLQEMMQCGGLLGFAGELDVDCFMEALLDRDWDARSLCRLKIIAFSRSAETALAARGIKADRSVRPGDPAEALADFDSGRSSRLALAHCGFEGQALETSLRKLRNDLFVLKTSEESAAVWEAHWESELVENPPDYIVFTGAGEVEKWFGLLGDEKALALAEKSRIGALDEFVAEALQKRGLRVDVRPDVSSFEALAAALAADSGLAG